MVRWQLSRVQYGVGLGILVGTWIHFPAPRALFVFAITSTLTALRFRALGWKPTRALIPFAIAAVGAALAAVAGARLNIAVTHTWRAAAVISQLGMTIRAIFAWADCDPRSPKMALLLDTLAKRRAVIALSREAEPIGAERKRQFALMMALHEELRRHREKFGHSPSAEIDEIRARMEAQQEALDRVRAAESELNDRRRDAAERLAEATKALKEKRRAA